MVTTQAWIRSSQQVPKWYHLLTQIETMLASLRSVGDWYFPNIVEPVLG